MHILLIPDSFKDSISATAICKVLANGFQEIDPLITTESCIASDGGEGFLDFVRRYDQVTLIPVPTVDPLGRAIVADYAFAKASQTAYIELAKASGLELLSQEKRDPLKTSTYGTGLQIAHAIKKGAKDIFIGLGGSATNDGGMGMATAVGYSFLDHQGNVLKANGSALNKIRNIKKPDALSLPKIYAVNDVDNPLTGSSGAAFVYGKQKGASSEDIVILDNGLCNLAEITDIQLKKRVAKDSGSGAAGGSAFGLKAFLDASFIPGVTFLAKLSGIEKRLKAGHIDLIITGEGSIDSQTSSGKLVKGVTILGKKFDIPVIGICGVNRLDGEAIKELGLKDVFAISDFASSTKDSMINASKYINEIVHLIHIKAGIS